MDKTTPNPIPASSDFDKSNLGILYAFFFLHLEADKKVMAVMRCLHLLYGMDDAHAKMLAFLSYFTYSPWHSIPESAAALNVATNEAKTILDSLVTKGAAEKSSDHGKILYRVDNSFEERLHYDVNKNEFDDQKLFKAIGIYCRDILHQAVLPSHPIETIEAILTLNDHLTFAKGYEELGIRHLSVEEKTFFILLAGTFIQRGVEPVRPKDFDVIRSEDEAAMPHENRYAGPDREYIEYGPRETLIAEGMRGLVRRGIAVIVPGESDADHRAGKDRDWCLLSVDACAKLFKGQDQFIGYDALSRTATLFKSAAIRTKDLFFDADFRTRVKEIETLLAPEKYDEFTRRLEGKGLNKSVNILFHGLPGTGKTELAMQLARQSGRDIFIADMAKLEDSYWGESEKNYRAIFRTFSYICAISNNPPILLLNEADGIVSKRVEVYRSSDKYVNSIQNVLLEELERFEGVLIATTNLTVNMDKAFERRFPFKLYFGCPSPETASRIWAARFPYLAHEDILRLAGEFPFSGGQIDNVAKRGDLYEVINGTPPSVEQIVEYCRTESLEGSDGVAGRTIINGFLEPK